MDPLLVNVVVVLGLMIFTWFISVLLRDASIVDPIWGLGFVLIAIASMANANCFNTASLILGLFSFVWGIRLSIYLTWRKLREPEEDYRYRAMREKRRDNFWWRSFFTVFMLQAVVMFFVSLPIQLGILRNYCGELSITGWLFLAVGSVIWIVGVFFETVGDWQLASFKSNPKNDGKVLDAGLWRYTRHPNYFGDFSVCWGLWLVSIAAGGPGWTIICPAVMSWLLMKVSGITLTEEKINERRPDYAEYKKRTNAFFPWRPKDST